MARYMGNVKMKEEPKKGNLEKTSEELRKDAFGKRWKNYDDILNQLNQNGSIGAYRVK